MAPSGYQDLVDYMNDNGVPFDNSGAEDALGVICEAVDGKPMDPGFRRQALRAARGAGVPAWKALSTAVAGCYETGHAERPAAAKITYTSSCNGDYPQVFVTGDGSERTPRGYRFIADVRLWNEGEVPGVATVRVAWHLVGGGQVVARDVVRVEPGRSRLVGFTKPATLDQIQRMGAHQYGDKLCSTRVATIKDSSW